MLGGGCLVRVGGRSKTGLIAISQRFSCRDGSHALNCSGIRHDDARSPSPSAKEGRLCRLHAAESFSLTIHAQPVVRHLHVVWQEVRSRSRLQATLPPSMRRRSSASARTNLAVQFPGVEPGTLNTLRWQSWNTTLHYNRLSGTGQSAFKR